MNNRFFTLLLIGLLISILNIKEAKAMDGILNFFTTCFKVVGDKAYTAAKSLNDLNGVEKLKEAINDTSKVVNNVAEATKDNGAKLDAINASVTAINAKATITATGATLAGTAGGLWIGSSIKNWIWPSAEQEAFKEKALHDQAILKAFSALNKCLTDNKEKSKNDEGMPYLCENVMNQYSETAGFAAFNDVKAAYKRK